MRSLALMRLRHFCFLLLASVAHSKPWYEEMKIGPVWANTFQDRQEEGKRIAAIKGLLIELGDGHRALFDTETLSLVTAYEGAWEWGGTPWTGKHGTYVCLENASPLFANPVGVAWADPAGSFADTRAIPGFGNYAHARFEGYFRHGATIVFHYRVNGVEILETLQQDGGTLTRSFQCAASEKALTLRLPRRDSFYISASPKIQLVTDPQDATRQLATIPASPSAQVFQIAFALTPDPKIAAVPDFKKLTAGGPALFPEIIETKGAISSDTSAPYRTDVLTLPTENSWKSNLRFGGFDFIDEDSAALSSWNGDVWVVRGLKGDWSNLKWQRIASGLFEPLGVKVVKGSIFVNGRDQITQLIDLNGDGETDHFKTFNRDCIVSPNFHEFTFDLQTDAAGNFYFAKGAPVRGGGRGFDQILPNHGTVMKVSPDGKKLEVVATGLRAPGGIGIGPNGEITTGENEGTNQPCCKINYLPASQQGPAFFGTEASRQSLKDAPYTEPLCYLPMAVDNSGGSQVWVPKGANFGIADGTLLHLSYGQSSIYQVLPVPRGKTLQGGVVKLPISLQSSAMRARFHSDGSLYVLGFRGWQTNAATECAFQRVRYNAAVAVPTPASLEYTATGIRLKFSVKLDPELVADLNSYQAQRWNYVRGPQYGSGEFSVDQPDLAAEKLALEKESKDYRVRDDIKVEAAKLLPDGQTVELTLAGMKPSMTLKVTYDLEDAAAQVVKGELFATVYGN
jgi:hypothetical protein